MLNSYLMVRAVLPTVTLLTLLLFLQATNLDATIAMHGTFKTAQDLSWHQSTYTICNISRALMREKKHAITNIHTNNITRFTKIFFTTTDHHLHKLPSHTMLFSMHGSGNYNRRFHPYMRPIPEVPNFPRTHDYNNINECLGRTMDLISLINKPIDSAPMQELPVVWRLWRDGWFEIGSTIDHNNDISLDLKLQVDLGF